MEEAIRVNDDYQVYSKMMDIYVSSNKTQVSISLKDRSRLH